MTTMIENQKDTTDQNGEWSMDNNSSSKCRDTEMIEMNYQSFPENKLPVVSNETKQYGVRDDHCTNNEYRGFRTSIADMYRDSNNERVDCCSIACFGCLQADRNRYIVKSINPPGLCRRICLHVILPLVLFGLALFTSFHIPDPYMNEMFCYGFVLFFVLYFFYQCGKGSWKRRHVRKNLLWAKYKKSTSGSFQSKDNKDSDEDSDDDDVGDKEFLNGQTKSDIRNAHAFCGCYKNDRSPDFYFDAEEEINCCSRAFDCYTNICCSKLCGFHLQLCGFCGVAQESREIEAIVRPGVLRIDYVTMQPMMEYYSKIYEARHRTDGPTTTSWFDRLSLFSQKTLKNCLVALVVLFVWSLLSKEFNHKFGLGNYLILCLTLMQSFVILVVVYWKHTKDISIDALIKFLCCGFCLSTTLAIFFELFLGIIVRIIMACLMAMSGIDVVQENGYSLAVEPAFGNYWNSAQEVNYGGMNYREYLTAYANDHPIIYTLYLLVTSFVLAALIEEICKYFGFRMVDHPDFYSEAEVEKAMEAMEDLDDNKQQKEPSVTSFPNQNRSLRSRGAAITVSMVAVGIGFACCENLVYVFLYGKIYNVSAIFILLARSLFPVHPIAMAIQSISVCERDLENDKRIRIGKIILPSVLFHGFYDFMLVWIDYISGSHHISSIVSAIILLGGVIYYVLKSRKQRKRFAVLDGESIIAESYLA